MGNEFLRRAVLGQIGHCQGKLYLEHLSLDSVWLKDLLMAHERFLKTYNAGMFLLRAEMFCISPLLWIPPDMASSRP